jgi:hypothetical protein
VAPLYRQGLSITDIAEQTGLARTSIWNSLRAHKAELRPQDPVPYDRWRQGHGKMRARPPYGFSYFQGEIIKDPAEYPVLQLIESLRKQGLSISSIVRKLEAKGIKSRMKKPWSYNVVKATIGRLQDGSLENLIAENESKRSKNKTNGGKK